MGEKKLAVKREMKSFRAVCACSADMDRIVLSRTHSVRCSCGVDYIRVRTGPLGLGTELCAEYGCPASPDWWPKVAAELPDDILRAKVFKWDPDETGIHIRLFNRAGWLQIGSPLELLESTPVEMGLHLAECWQREVPGATASPALSESPLAEAPR